MQDYKSLCAAVATVPPWLTPRERHTHIHTQAALDQLIS